MTIAAITDNGGAFTKADINKVNEIATQVNTLTASTAGGTLTSAHLLVGNGSNVATDVAVSGDLTLANTGAFTLGTVSGAVKSSSASAGVGYATGAGFAVAQGTNRTTGVTSDTPCGSITLVSAAGSATPASFTVTCAACAATDVVHVCQKSGTDLYEIFVTAVGTGSFRITSFTTGGTTTETPVFNYAIIKSVAA